MSMRLDNLFDQILKVKQAKTAMVNAEIAYDRENVLLSNLFRYYRSDTQPINVLYERGGKKYFFNGYEFISINT